jgi:glycosyltransferase involved in cell wall biosynthesis
MEANHDWRLPELSLIIPAYNEAAAITDIVRRSTEALAQCAVNWEVIVVSDCSTDGTAELAVTAGARIIKHPTNKGYGNSIKTGICNASYCKVAIIDGDGSYLPEELRLLVLHALKFDMVVGQRSGYHFRGGPFKRAGRRLQHFLIEFTTGTKVPDVNSGLRIFPRDVALNFFDTLCGGFSFTTSITLSMMMCGYTITFIPITYTTRIGNSHIHYYRDTLRSLQIITHAILKYNPIKAFIPLCAVALLCSTISGILASSAFFFRQIPQALWLGLFTVICFMTALIIFALGLVATSIFVTAQTPAQSDKRRF